MIPKTIHYCWFGRNPLPETAQKCIGSWAKYCPSYEIVGWSEDNFDISTCPQFVKDAYRLKKWAFVSDYVRLKVVYENGGIYFDTDVELISCIDQFLKYNGLFCFEDGKHINTGLGFGATAGLSILKEMMDAYEMLSFINADGSLNQVTCPIINTQVFLRHGLRQNNKTQTLDGNIKVLSSVYMCPIDYETGILKVTKKTISIHWFDSSWMSQADKEYHEKHRQAVLAARMEYWRYLPHRIIMKLLGPKMYSKLKEAIKK